MTQFERSSSRVVWNERDLTTNPHETPDKAERVRRMFAAIARSYDLNNRLHSFGRDQSWRRAAVQLSDVKSSDHVLDVACGTGDLAEAYSTAQPASVIGVDFCEPMLEIALQKSKRLHRHNTEVQPEYQVGDAMELAFDNASFDIVSIAFGIRNVAIPSHALREFHRVLRKGGRAVILEFSQPTNQVLRYLNYLYCDHIMPFTASLISADRSGAYRYLPRSVANFPNPSDFIDLLKQCGFESVQSYPQTFGVCTVYIAHAG